jgi:hypothetical protein
MKSFDSIIHGRKGLVVDHCPPKAMMKLFVRNWMLLKISFSSNGTKNPVALKSFGKK